MRTWPFDSGWSSYQNRVWQPVWLKGLKIVKYWISRTMKLVWIRSVTLSKSCIDLGYTLPFYLIVFCLRIYLIHLKSYFTLFFNTWKAVTQRPFTLWLADLWTNCKSSIVYWNNCYIESNNTYFWKCFFTLMYYYTYMYIFKWLFSWQKHLQLINI